MSDRVKFKIAAAEDRDVLVTATIRMKESVLRDAREDHLLHAKVTEALSHANLDDIYEQFEAAL